jgi:hypothetical protein
MQMGTRGPEPLGDSHERWFKVRGLRITHGRAKLQLYTCCPMQLVLACSRVTPGAAPVTGISSDDACTLTTAMGMQAGQGLE